MSVANILSLLILLSGVVVGAWAIYSALAKKIDDMEASTDSKIKRVYERQDEEFDKVQKEYIRIDVHNASIEHIKEIMEIKSNSTILLFNTKLDNLAKAVNELIDRVNKKEGL